MLNLIRETIRDWYIAGIAVGAILGGLYVASLYYEIQRSSPETPVAVLNMQEQGRAGTN